MNCTRCGKETSVADSRPKLFEDETSVKRRRECDSCGYRFTTYEVREGGYVMARYKKAALLDKIFNMLKGECDEGERDKEDSGGLLPSGLNDKKQGEEILAAKATSALPSEKTHTPVANPNRRPHKYKPSYHHTF